MSRGKCRMNGIGDHGGLITLEELESLTEDESGSSPDLGDAGEPSPTDEGAVEDAGQSRLLSFWQDIGRGHRIDIPQDMAQPIHQLTTETENSPNREMVPFTTVTCNDKYGNVLYEKRTIEKGCWACITVREDTYEQSICAGFMKIMKYICEQNSSGKYLGMTIPIVTVVQTDDAHTRLSRDVTVAYYLPTLLQDQPPQPTDPEITVETWPNTVIYSRMFTGPTNETTILKEIHVLAELLDCPDLWVNKTFIIAGYTSVAAADRLNEVWFLERQ